jgi:peroxiredoxin
MKKKDILITLVLVVVIMAAAGLWLSPSLLIQEAPDAELQSIDGQKIRLTELHGKPVLITFWATTCPGCLEEQPHLVALYNRLHEQGLEIIGIAMAYDPPNQVLALQKKRQLPYTIALDLDGSAARAFDDVRLTPTSFLISPEGRIVYKKIGVLDMVKLEKTIQKMLTKG